MNISINSIFIAIIIINLIIIFSIKRKFNLLKKETEQFTNSINNVKLIEDKKALELQIEEFKALLITTQNQYNLQLEKLENLKQVEINLNEKIKQLEKNNSNLELNNKTNESLENDLLTLQNKINLSNNTIIDFEQKLENLKQVEINLNEKIKQLEENNSNLELNNKTNEPAITKKSILMVDDSLVIRTKMNKLLLNAGYDVVLANDGVDALNKLSKQNFNLIITDLEMPNMDGFEFMINANNNPITKVIPVVVITGHEDIHFQVSQAANLAGVYKKPWKDIEVLEKIKFLCSLQNH